MTELRLFKVKYPITFATIAIIIIKFRGFIPAINVCRCSNKINSFSPSLCVKNDACESPGEPQRIMEQKSRHRAKKRQKREREKGNYDERYSIFQGRLDSFFSRARQRDRRLLHPTVKQVARARGQSCNHSCHSYSSKVSITGS